MPPYIKLFGIKIPLPQLFVFRALPMFRTFARFGVYAILSISVLASLGMKEWLSTIKTQTKKACLYTMSLTIICAEFLFNPLSFRTDLDKTPDAYRWLSRKKGDFIICEYPLSKNLDLRTDWLIWQRIHKKRKVDGALPGTRAEELRSHILKLQDRNTPSFLCWVGVKYVLVHREGMKRSEALDIVGQIPDFDKQRGLKLIEQFGDIVIYEVTAKPLKIEGTQKP
jgi:hypothetical protein